MAGLSLSGIRYRMPQNRMAELGLPVARSAQLSSVRLGAPTLADHRPPECST